MDKEYENVCVALENLASAIAGASSDPRPLMELVGWMAPAISMREVSEIALSLASDMRKVAPEECKYELREYLRQATQRITLMVAHVIPQLTNGNIGQAFPAYLGTINSIRDHVLPQVGWVSVPTLTAIPVAVLTKANSASARLATAERIVSDIDKKIRDIDRVHSISSNFDADLTALTEARERVEKTSDFITYQAEKLKRDHESAVANVTAISQESERAKSLIALCEDAYSITTTKGLAAAFDLRAKSLAVSIRFWVSGLMVALGTGYYFGSQRINILTSELGSENPKWGLITAHAVVGLLSIGAPLWFSWLATKQINQRFRLSEDYAFKASVAKAYEGYRKEAAKLDPEFQAKLFGSALARLDEAPLRLMEKQEHGSPWQEFANSDTVKQAMKAAPELQTRLVDLVRDAMTKSSNAVGEASRVVENVSKTKLQSTTARAEHNPVEEKG